MNNRALGDNLNLDSNLKLYCALAGDHDVRL